MMSGPSAPIQIGEWVADPETDTISRGGETQKLEPRTMRLLLLLAQSPGSVFSVEKMLSEIWPGVVVGPASVYQAVSQLRRLLKDTDPEPTHIATVPRKGYRLIAPVRALAPPAPAPTAAPNFTPVGQPLASAPPPAARPRRTIFRALAISIGVALVMAGAWFVWHSYFATPDPISRSIVVIPFDDMTEDHVDQSFCDGLTEELSNWLAQIPTLRVLARTSALKFHRKDDVRQIGRELNVTDVLEGSIRQSGDHIRVSVQLIDTHTTDQVWNQDFDHPVEDAIEMQDDIARAVAEALQIRLTTATTQKFNERRTASSKAYTSYLMAMHAQSERSRDSNLQAIDMFDDAVKADPRFALAYIGQAYATLNQLWLNSRSLAEVSVAAERLLTVAAQLDPNLSELYAVRGALREEQWRYDESEKDLRRAVELNPNDSWAFAELGRLYVAMGHPRDAELNLQHALSLDPVDYVLYARECIALQDTAHYDLARTACARSRELQSGGNFGTLASSWLEWTQGHIPEALGWNAAALKLDPTDINLYERRADLLLTLGLAKSARQTFERARAITRNDEKVDVGLAAITYYENGAAALRAHLQTTRLDDARDPRNLVQVAYYHMLAGEPAAAADLIARVINTPDLNAGKMNSLWYARWGE